ncbi:MFS transporter [Dyella flava]|uniref:MFS transporter n=1 Tax=Dyella flava TaxID=1920170 RepID=A0ABS2K5M2_9GAMM|nr:MFS transporter [Dyella flava]MBM7126459.1 MFS transporter [Dyella flava]GLQ49723.1 MFS transporter [Dyella flava]
MSVLSALRELNHEQRHTVLASFLGWTLDAFDYFIFTFVIVGIANEFHVDRTEVTLGVFLTLMARPVGAFLFGRLADRYGRRPVLMIDVILFSIFELATAFSPSITVLLAMRFLFGVAMGGEWGIGASLVMESIPPKSRGLVSGLLQSGYPCGFFLGALVNWLLVDHIGWRGLFVVGAVPALLVLYIRRKVPESPAWEASLAEHGKRSLGEAMRGHWKLAIYLMCLMAAFNMFSHGSQDMYHTFEEVNLHLPTGSSAAFVLVALLNLGALVGGIFFGAWSEKIGRRRAMIISALLAIPVIPLWTYGGSLLLLGLGAFLIQVMVQGAWGVVPTHLNELSPDAVRGTLPGFAYQMGNLIAAGTATAQSWLASQDGLGLPLVMSLWIAVVAVLLALLVWLGPEARGVGFGQSRS